MGKARRLNRRCLRHLTAISGGVKRFAESLLEPLENGCILGYLTNQAETILERASMLRDELRQFKDAHPDSESGVANVE